MPTSPNLLFTNAGMNQFVPYFLGERPAPFKRAADTQKCIRAGGKHNDLEDVGFDTYHHTMFEMLGNWSFGDYFKKEAIEWAWELLTEIWKMPKNRLYATVYSPGEGDPAAFDQEAYNYWAKIFTDAGLDPKVHIVYGNKKDNFWMMGETGPCGPCSEIHIDLTPKGDSQGKLVNQDSPWCIEIWNLVFMEFNANPDGSFSSLPAKNVDTGMGLERVAGIMATTKGFTDFSHSPSNYNSDLFTDIFEEITKMSGHQYGFSMPADRNNMSKEEMKDCVFRVLADHIRTLSFSIADGILPGNEGRNYVLRRILRRAIMFGKRIDLPAGFFSRLATPLIGKMGSFFPELVTHEKTIRKVLASEENSFDQTLDRGIKIFDSYCREVDMLKTAIETERGADSVEVVAPIVRNILTQHPLLQEQLLEIYGRIFNLKIDGEVLEFLVRQLSPLFVKDFSKDKILDELRKVILENLNILPGKFVFSLYDTYGFPFDLTQLLAREKGFIVDAEGAEVEMEKQRGRARGAQKKTIIRLAEEGHGEATAFNGFDEENLSNFHANIQEIVTSGNDVYVILNKTPFYAEMGGQVGDTGSIKVGDESYRVASTIKDEHGRILHKIENAQEGSILESSPVVCFVDLGRRRAIQRNHTATHILDWALRKTLGAHVHQTGSLVDPQRLRFDFSHFESLNSEQISDVEQLCNQMVLSNYPVEWYETEFDKKPENCIAVFGEKYGAIVRVVDIGGISVELCGGTHVRATGEIGFIKILSETGISAGNRRIEAVAGEAAIDFATHNVTILHALAQKFSCKPEEVGIRIDALSEQKAQMEKELRKYQQKNAAGAAEEIAKAAVKKDEVVWAVASTNVDTKDLRSLAVNISKILEEANVVVLANTHEGKVGIVALATDKAVASGVSAGNIVRDITAKLGGKGGGKADFAQGGAPSDKNLTGILDSYR